MTTASAPRERMFRLWFGVLGPPAFWAIRLSASYVMVPFACRSGDVLPLHLVAAGALAATALAGGVAYRAWRRTRLEPPVDQWHDRSRFVATIGILSAGFFFAVIAAESAANFVIDPCVDAGATL